MPCVPGRPDGFEAAALLISERFPDCLAAFVSGSVVRGDATATSDLDLFVIVDSEEAPYRDSLVFKGWPVESFVHTTQSYRDYFASDAQRGTPTLPVMCIESVVLKDTDGLAGRIQEEARALVAAGPEPLTPQELCRDRYFLTDLLEDFAGSSDEAETLVIAAALATASADLVLAHRRRWRGRNKWALRALERAEPELASELRTALSCFRSCGTKEPLARFAERVLDLAGGRLFEGYRVAGRRKGQT
jgi:hypothetical protein